MFGQQIADCRHLRSPPPRNASRVGSRRIAAAVYLMIRNRSPASVPRTAMVRLTQGRRSAYDFRQKSPSAASEIHRQRPLVGLPWCSPPSFLQSMARWLVPSCPMIPAVPDPRGTPAGSLSGGPLDGRHLLPLVRAVTSLPKRQPYLTRLQTGWSPASARRIARVTAGKEAAPG